MSNDANAIRELETRFWQSMVDKDIATAKAMVADESLITGPKGTLKITPDKYEEIARSGGGGWELRTFKFTDMDVVFASDDTAVTAYKVHQTGEMNGEPAEYVCADSSTWVRDGDTWKCALHTEAVLEG